MGLLGCGRVCLRGMLQMHLVRAALCLLALVDRGACVSLSAYNSENALTQVVHN